MNALAAGPYKIRGEVSDQNYELSSSEITKVFVLQLPEMYCDPEDINDLTACTLNLGQTQYTLSHQDPSVSLPTGLFSLDVTTHELTTTASRAHETETGWALRYEITDPDGVVTSFDFVVRIDGHPYVSNLSDLNLTVGEPMDAVKLSITSKSDVTATLSDASECFNAPPPHDSLTPDFYGLPGLAISVDNTRASDAPLGVSATISGEMERPGECDAEVIVTDADGDEVETSFKVFINAAPSFGGARVPNTVFAIGQSGEITLPEPMLGNGKWSHHSVSWDPLPSWLSFSEINPAALKLSGTPPVGSDADAVTFSVEVTDYKLNDRFGRDSDEITLCFSVGDGALCEVDFGDATVDSQIYALNTAITPLILPEVSRATGTARYSVSGLPAGLVFDSDTRELSGTPTEFGSFNATYTATDSADTSASLTFGIEVDGAPSFAGSRVANTVFAIGEEGEITLPELTLGNGTWAQHTRSWDLALPT